MCNEGYQAIKHKPVYFTELVDLLRLPFFVIKKWDGLTERCRDWRGQKVTTSGLPLKAPFCQSLSERRKSGSHHWTALGPLFAEWRTKKLTFAGQVQEAFSVGRAWLNGRRKLLETSERSWTKRTVNAFLWCKCRTLKIGLSSHLFR